MIRIIGMIVININFSTAQVGNEIYIPVGAGKEHLRTKSVKKKI